MPTDARAINDMVDIVNVLRNLNFDCTQFNVTIDTAVRVRLKKQEIPGFPWGEEYTFGMTRPAKNQIKLWNSKARRYGDPQGSSIYYTCPDTVITFAGDGAGQRICWQWDNSSDGGPVFSIMPNPQVNDPLDASNIIYGVVAVFNVDNGFPTLTDYQQCGFVVLPFLSPATV